MIKKQRARGNPTWRKGGPSPNPLGRGAREMRTDAASAPRTVRRDGWVNRASGHGTARDARVFTEHELIAVTDLEGLTLWRSDDILGRIAEAKPFDAWRRGINIHTDDPDLMKWAKHEIKRLSVAAKFKNAGAMERGLGGAAILPIFEGAPLASLADPLPEDPGHRRIKALHVIQPRELVPVDWYADIEDERFRYPAAYNFIPVNVLGYATKATYVTIHASRLIVFDGVRCVPHHVIGQRIGWGDSVFLRVRQVAAEFGISWGSAAALLSKFAEGVYAMDGLHDQLAKRGGQQNVRDRIAFLDELSSTIRAAVIDGKDKYERRQTPVTGMPDMLIQLAQRVAAAAEMPVTRLMGMSPSGLNATGEADMRTWYDSVEVYRQDYEPKVYQFMEWLWQSADSPNGGVIPDGWSMEWPPLWQPTAKETADERLAIAQADKIYAIDIGAVTPAQLARSRWGSGKFSPEMHIEPDEIEAMEQHESDLQDAQLEQAQNAAEAAKTPPAPVDPNAPPAPEVGAQPGANGEPDAATRARAPRTDAETAADDISRELESDYPERALEWIRTIKWVGPVRVPTDRIDSSAKATWRASSELDKVDKFADRIMSGREKPLLLVEIPGKDKLDVIDGHHRELAYEKLGDKAPGGGALAYVGKAPAPIGPWTEFHSKQRDSADKRSARAQNGTDPGHGWSAGWGHAPAFDPKAL